MADLLVNVNVALIQLVDCRPPLRTLWLACSASCSLRAGTQSDYTWVSARWRRVGKRADWPVWCRLWSVRFSLRSSQHHSEERRVSKVRGSAFFVSLARFWFIIEVEFIDLFRQTTNNKLLSFILSSDWSWWETGLWLRLIRVWLCVCNNSAPVAWMLCDIKKFWVLAAVGYRMLLSVSGSGHRPVELTGFCSLQTWTTWTIQTTWATWTTATWTTAITPCPQTTTPPVDTTMVEEEEGRMGTMEDMEAWWGVGLINATCYQHANLAVASCWFTPHMLVQCRANILTLFPRQWPSTLATTTWSFCSAVCSSTHPEVSLHFLLILYLHFYPYTVTFCFFFCFW